MRETKSYINTKGNVEEFLKMKPYTNIKGKVTLQLINNKTNEVEKEVFTENIRMKWLEYQMNINAIESIGFVWDFITEYAGASESYGVRYNRGGNFKNIILVNSDETGDENEKIPSLDGSVLGFAGFDTLYSGDSSTQGNFNKTESNIKMSDEGNLVVHTVYDFPTQACNGSITHVGFGKNFGDKYSYRNNFVYGTDWQTIKGLPSPATITYYTSSSTVSWNCFNVSKNVFRFVKYEGSPDYLAIYDLNIVTGCIINKANITGYSKTPINTSTYFRCRNMSISKDGSCAYLFGYNSRQYENTGATGSGWSLLTISCDTGEIIGDVFYGEIQINGTSSNFNQYSVGVYDQTGYIYIFGSSSGNLINYLQKISATDGSFVKGNQPYEYTDTDNVGSSDFYRGCLVLNNDEIIYRSNYYTTKKGIVFDKTALTVKKKLSNVQDKISISMDIIGKEGLAVGTCVSNDNGNSNSSKEYHYWGIFDKRHETPFTTLTKLPSPVLKTAVYTMKVQYDVIFEVPNVLDAF